MGQCGERAGCGETLSGYHAPTRAPLNDAGTCANYQGKQYLGHCGGSVGAEAIGNTSLDRAHSIARWQDYQQSFSERVYGSRARELAIQAREEMLNLVDETRTFTRSPGAIAEASPAEFPAALPRPPHALTVRVRRTGINGGVVNKNIYVSVSDAISSRAQKTFNTGVHGQVGAFRLAMQAALTLVTQFGGEEVGQIFMRDYVEKYKRLTKNGVSARIRFMPVEDSKK